MIQLRFLKRNVFKAASISISVLPKQMLGYRHCASLPEVRKMADNQFILDLNLY